MSWIGALAPGTVGGRRAHPPKAAKEWQLKINVNERKKAIRSALSGAFVNNNLFVVEDKMESIKKTKDVLNTMKVLGLGIQIVKRKKAGRGKTRGRKVTYKKNALIVVAGKCDLMKSALNLPGLDIVDAKSVNVSLLTVGQSTRKCLFTEGAIEKISKEELFT